jgi:hypothetical protein
MLLCAVTLLLLLLLMLLLPQVLELPDQQVK